MNIDRHTWLKYSLITLVSLSLWFKFSYPQLTFVKLKIDRSQAIAAAQEYLRSQGEAVEDFKFAGILSLDSATNKYLQKTVGFDGMLDFLQTHNFDMFYWLVRFFKEGEIEEYRLTVSALSGEIIAYKHHIKETDAKPLIEREPARVKAIFFLNKNFNFQEDLFTTKGDLRTIFDNRSEYAFSWIKNAVAIPWSEKPDSGTAKLATGVTVSGDDFLSFYKHSFIVPEEFYREEARKSNIAYNIGVVVNVLSQLLLIVSIYFLIVRRNHLAMHLTKRFYIGCALLAMGLAVASFFNQFESFIFNYRTTVPFGDHLIRSLINLITSATIASIALLMPGLSGELLRYEVDRAKSQGSFLSFCLSSFFSRRVAVLIGFGYIIFLILLGMQAVIITLGQGYLGVWTEQIMMTRLTNAYWPALAALTVGFSAAVFEEIMYRLFAISLFRKIFKNTFWAVFLSSVIWGFAHTGYPVYPMWFRGIEVSILGVFLGFIYVRFGLIPVIIAHFLFDVFWSCSAFLFGEVKWELYLSSLFVLFLPLFWAAVAYFLNRSSQERPMAWMLNAHQRFNLQVLATYLRHNPDEFKGLTEEETISRLSAHGWDIAVVQEAVKSLRAS